MKKVILSILILSVFAFASCQSVKSDGLDSTVINGIKQISVQDANEVVKAGNVQFIDVRTVEEFEGGHASKTVNIPLDALESELAKLDKNKPVYLICRTGRRSQTAAEIMQKKDFRELYNVEGGTLAWISADLPMEK